MNIFAVIVTYNPNLENLNKLIGSIKANGVEPIIVDNNSLNLESFCNNIFLKLNDNEGIAKAQNIGSLEAIARGAEYIIYFDQDSTISNNFIIMLAKDFIEIQKHDSKISAIGPRFVDERHDFYYPALKLNKFGLLDKIDTTNILEPIEVSILISSGTLVSISSLQNIGLMKEEFFIDFVDTEWCFRALSCGYTIYLSSKATMRHTIGDDVIRFMNINVPVHSAFRRYFRVRNLFYMKKMPYIPKNIVTRLMITNFIHQFLLILLRKNKVDYIKYYFKALRDGIKMSKNYNA